jgi:hypothetical protein
VLTELNSYSGITFVARLVVGAAFSILVSGANSAKNP